MPTTRKTLVPFAHPVCKRSQMSAALRGAVKGLAGGPSTTCMPNIRIFLIDVSKEVKG
jgi:hypothetical protein